MNKQTNTTKPTKTICHSENTEQQNKCGGKCIGSRASKADLMISEQILPKPEVGETVTEMGCRRISCIIHVFHDQSILSSY